VNTETPPPITDALDEGRVGGQQSGEPLAGEGVGEKHVTGFGGLGVAFPSHSLRNDQQTSGKRWCFRGTQPRRPELGGNILRVERIYETG
jgi:hypothetical protein